MAATEDGESTQVWRSRAFIQPLLLTIGGFVASFAAYAVIGAAGCLGSSCGYSSIASIFGFLLFLTLGLLVTGLLVGLSSRDSRLAVRAILVAVVIASLTVSIIVMVFDATRSNLDVRQFIDDLLAFGIVALVLLIPIALGFGVGRLVKRARGREA